MEPSTEENSITPVSSSPQNTSKFSVIVFAERILKAGFAILILGAIFIFLKDFDGCLKHPDTCPPPPELLAGAIALMALVLLGVPILPAAVVGLGVWLTIGYYLP